MPDDRDDPYALRLRRAKEYHGKYKEALGRLSLAPGNGVTIVCPTCNRRSWIKLPLMMWGYHLSLTISCPAACGYYEELSSFSPRPEPIEPPEYDIHAFCKSCEMAFAVDGAVCRRPCCGIENAREVMDVVVNEIRLGCEVIQISSNDGRVELEAMASKLVSTFDGVMRSMLLIANENLRYLQRADPSYEVHGYFRELPSKLSFQNLKAARSKLLSNGFDMVGISDDWDSLVRVFQKRHLIAHGLGVVDKKYIIETNDTSTPVGKRTSFTTQEIISAAADCRKIVWHFFGVFLS